jgi:predicted RNA binding protein YcfA (HicA-like mRNA interferase family)
MQESEEIIRRLRKDGWVEVSRKGSHVTFKKEEERNLITVPILERPSARASSGRSPGWRGGDPPGRHGFEI